MKVSVKSVKSVNTRLQIMIQDCDVGGVCYDGCVCGDSITDTG